LKSEEQGSSDLIFSAERNPNQDAGFMKTTERTKHIAFAEPRHIESLSDCFFYHTMTLPGFGEVRGHWDLRGQFNNYIGGLDVNGKSVIDIGTATGFLSFEAERKGASEVLSFDIAHSRQQSFLPFKDKLHYRDPENQNVELEQWKNAYWLCHRLLNSKARVHYGNIYDLPAELGQFDIALVGSVLEHLSDPINALAAISRLVRETIVIVSPIIQSEERIARFEGLADHPDNDFTWWTYSTGLYREVFKMLGFSIDRITESQYFYHYRERLETRYTLVAVRTSS
jgi:2-polyprenyl-3-methyl-5-hydroxy-6-metoxy-1,4-benzoquinol methylase